MNCFIPISNSHFLLCVYQAQNEEISQLMFSLNSMLFLCLGQVVQPVFFSISVISYKSVLYIFIELIHVTTIYKYMLNLPNSHLHVVDYFSRVSEIWEAVNQGQELQLQHTKINNSFIHLPLHLLVFLSRIAFVEIIFPYLLVGKKIYGQS